MIRIFVTLVCAVYAAGATIPKTLDLRVDEQELFVLVERIARQCDAGLAIAHAVQPVLDKRVTLYAKDAPWGEAVALLAKEYRLSLTLEGERLVVGDADVEFIKRLEVRYYTTRVITAPTPHFPGPDLDLPEPGGVGSRLLAPIQDDVPPELGDTLAVLRSLTGGESWEHGAAAEEFEDSLVVTQVPEVHAEVRALLEQLERVAARQLVCRVYQLAAEGAPSGPVIDAAGWQVRSAALPAPVGVFILRDGQQNHHFAGTQRTFIADVDVVQEVFDPVMSMVSHGLMVDVQPQVTVDGVLCAMRFSASSEGTERSVVMRDGNDQALISVANPASGIDKARDTRLIPSGGAAIYRFNDRIWAIAFEVLDYRDGK